MPGPSPTRSGECLRRAPAPIATTILRYQTSNPRARQRPRERANGCQRQPVRGSRPHRTRAGGRARVASRVMSHQPPIKTPSDGAPEPVLRPRIRRRRRRTAQWPPPRKKPSGAPAGVRCTWNLSLRRQRPARVGAQHRKYQAIGAASGWHGGKAWAALLHMSRSAHPPRCQGGLRDGAGDERRAATPAQAAPREHGPTISIGRGVCSGELRSDRPQGNHTSP